MMGDPNSTGIGRTSQSLSPGFRRADGFTIASGTLTGRAIPHTQNLNPLIG